MRPAYKQHVREFVKGGRATFGHHSLNEGLCLKNTRNHPSGDPNCEPSPQSLIIPVLPSTPPYRPVGICENNWAVSPYRDAKRKPPNQRVRRPLFPLFRWWLCAMATPKQHQAVLGSTKMRAQKPVPVIPTRLEIRGLLQLTVSLLTLSCSVAYAVSNLFALIPYSRTGLLPMHLRGSFPGVWA